jgi:hypothetical protein
MNADSITLDGLLGSAYQYIIPVFQRYYSWGRSDWENVWNDIAELRESEQNSQRHFMGSLVLGPQQQRDLGKPAVQVIDGQQRLMTFSLLMSAVRNIARDRGFDSLKEAVEETALVDPHEEGGDRFRVYPRQRDRDSFMAAVEGNGQVDGRIAEALDYFTERVESLEGAETEKELRAFFHLVRRHLEFVHIILGNENAYEIFRSLNSTGQPLSEADLVRNFVFMHVPLHKQDSFDDELWIPVERHFEDKDGNLNGSALSAFFRNFLMRDGRYVKPTATFQEFERRYSGAGFEPEDLAIELSWYADYYDVIRGVNAHASERVEAALSKLRGLRTATTYPLLLYLMHNYEEGETSEQDLVQCIEMTSGFILRRYVCGLSSRAYSRWFVSANRMLGEQPLEGLRHFYVNGRDFPNDEQFRQALIHFNLYQSDYGRYALEMLERSNDHREPPDLRQAQIEHIMPQTPTDEWKSDLGPEHERIHAEWLHTLGNLTLSAYNPQLYNHRFSIKCEEYSRSNIAITRRLTDYSSWGESEIRSRGEDLAERAANIWRGPES